jgi:hypothetical protein
MSESNSRFNVVRLCKYFTITNLENGEFIYSCSPQDESSIPISFNFEDMESIFKIIPFYIICSHRIKSYDQESKPEDENEDDYCKEPPFFLLGVNHIGPTLEDVNIVRDYMSSKFNIDPNYEFSLN